MKTARNIECISDAFMFKAKQYFDKEKFRDSASHILICITEFEEKNDQIHIIDSWLNDNNRLNNTLLLISLIVETKRIETNKCLTKERQRDRFGRFRKELVEYILKYSKDVLDKAPHEEIIELLFQLYQMGHREDELNEKIVNFVLNETKITINGESASSNRDKNKIVTFIEFPTDVLKISVFNKEFEWIASDDYFESKSSHLADTKAELVEKIDLLHAVANVYRYDEKLMIEIIAKEFLD